MMTFTRSLDRTVFSYLSRDSVTVRRDEFVTGLGFKLTSNLDPTAHIERSTCCKAFKTLGFIMRLAKLKSFL